jgi:hypothetical protein
MIFNLRLGIDSTGDCAIIDLAAAAVAATPAPINHSLLSMTFFSCPQSL